MAEATRWSSSLEALGTLSVYEYHMTSSPDEGAGYAVVPGPSTTASTYLTSHVRTDDGSACSR